MRKSDVETRYIRGEHLPAVNVKVHGSVAPAILETVERDTGETGFAAWGAALLDADKWPEWTWESALEIGWETLRNDAEELLGAGVTVESDGRSGGWCVVIGLPEIETWDAVQLAKWARFAKWARQEADAIPYLMADVLAINTYAAERERLAKVAATMHAAESQVA